MKHLPVMSFLSLTLATALLAFYSSAGDVYVSKNGIHPGEEDGLFWGTYQTEDGIDHNAYTNLQQAVNAASGGDTIWIEDGFVCDEGFTEVVTKDGTYRRRIETTKKLTIRSRSGSYESGTTIKGSWHDPEAKIPKGANAIQCISVGSGSKLIGLNIIDGASLSSGFMPGAGVTGSCQIERCFIANCAANYQTAWFNATKVTDSVVSNCIGGTYGTFGTSANVYNTLFINNPVGGNGINSFSSSHVISNCTFIGNTGGTTPVLIMGQQSQTTKGGKVIDCVFKDNSVSAVGPVYVKNCVSATVTNCLFTGNTVPPIYSTRWNGAATNNLVYVYNSIFTNNVCSGGNLIYHSGKYYNCLFYGNTSKDSLITTPDSVYSRVELYNCTVLNNNSTGAAGGVNSSSAILVNTIVYDNTSDKGTVGTVASAINSCLDDNTNAADETGTIHTPPLLVAPSKGLFMPGEKSLCRDGGSTDAYEMTLTDLAGRPRMTDGKVAIGAYEFDPSVNYYDYSVDYLSYLIAPAKVMFATWGSGLGEDVTYYWDFDRDGITDFVTADNSFTHYLGEGNYNPCLCVSNAFNGVSLAMDIPFVIIEKPIHYVDSNSQNPQSPYTTPETAAVNVLDAVAVAEDGHGVAILPGLYEIAEQIVVTKDISVYGTTGRPGDVVIRSKGTDRCLFLNGKENTIVHSLTLENGARNATYDFGGNVLISGVDVPKGQEHFFSATPTMGVLSNVVVRGGRVAAKFGVCAGVYACGEKALVTHCVISNNVSFSAYIDGGIGHGVAVQLLDGAKVEHSLITRNSTEAYGRTTWNNDNWKGYLNGQVHSTVFLTGGGAVRFSTIVDNTMSFCGGVNVVGSGVIEGCIIADNFIKCKSLAELNEPRYKVFSAFPTSYPVFYVKGGDEEELMARFMNFVAQEALTAGGMALSINGNVVDAVVNLEGAAPIVATKDALFKNPERGDYTLRAGSPAIDGLRISGGMPSCDLNGATRFMRGFYDYGCFEYQSPLGMMILLW